MTVFDTNREAVPFPPAGRAGAVAAAAAVELLIM